MVDMTFQLYESQLTPHYVSINVSRNFSDSLTILNQSNLSDIGK
jgi:hypothetical protein